VQATHAFEVVSQIGFVGSREQSALLAHATQNPRAPHAGNAGNLIGQNCGPKSSQRPHTPSGPQLGLTSLQSLLVVQPTVV